MTVKRPQRLSVKAQNCAGRIGFLLLGCFSVLSSVHAGPLGLVSDNGFAEVSIFNADYDVVTGKLDAYPGMATGDCAIASDEKRGFTSSNNGEISFLNLVGGEHQEVSHHKQVAISNLGVDMALSPNDAFLVMAGGGSLQQPLSVVDTFLEAEISTSGPFVDHTSVEFCDNGTMLVTTTHGEMFDEGLDNAVYDATIDSEGTLSLAGNRLSSGAQPNNAVCAPGSLAGVLLDREGGLTSFTLPGLIEADRKVLGTSGGVAAVFSKNGRSLFVRTQFSIVAYQFNPVSGAMTEQWQVAVPETSTFYGIEQIAMHPDDSKLYVDGGGPLLILNPETGAKLGAISFGDTTGICFANNQGPPVDQSIVLARNP